MPCIYPTCICIALKWYKKINYMKYRLLVIALLFLNFLTNAQSNTKIAGQSLPELQHPVSIEIDFLTIPTFYPSAISSTNVPSLSAVFKNYPTSSATAMPKAWAYEDLAFFCKIEVQMEKATKLPVKFRIGEVQQVERMEGKLK